MGTQTETDGDATAPERGVQYPGDNLADALAMLEKVRTAVGVGAAKRELIASAIGYKSLSGHAARRLGSLAHYGLLERAGKGAARISQLGKAILMPTSEAEKTLAIVEAVKQPNLFATLLAKHTGHALPTMLPNMLAREHGVNASVAEQAATTFRESVEFAGLLRNGVLYSSLESDDPAATGNNAAPASRTTAPESAGQVPKRVTEGAGEGPSADVMTYTIALDPRTTRVASISMPVPVTARDLRNVEAWVTYMKMAMLDEEAPDISGN